MPELPEVETMRRGILPVERGTIVAVKLPRARRLRPIQVAPSPSAFRKRVEGNRIDAVSRLGKRIVLELSNGERVVFEPRMTGLALLADPPTTEHVRARFQLKGAKVPELVLWDRRGLGTLSTYDPDEYVERLGPHRIGPDALALGRGGLEARLRASKRPVKVALLDQKALAGVGNIYASESLHRSRIDPRRPCETLSGREWGALQKALEAILEAAIRSEGSTLSDGTYRNALNQDGGYQNQFRVYDREGERCLRCKGKGTVERLVQAQRATFLCAGCQR